MRRERSHADSHSKKNNEYKLEWGREAKHKKRSNKWYDRGTNHSQRGRRCLQRTADLRAKIEYSFNLF